MTGDDASPGLRDAFPAELERAVLALWSGTIAGAARTAARKEASP